MKIVCISDTHCTPLAKLNLPEGDVLIHAGDATYRGTEAEIEQFNDELGLIKGRYTHGVLFTPGNHDWYFEKHYESSIVKKEAIITNGKCIIHDTIEIDGYKIFMSPYTPRFCDWAFNVDRGPGLAKLWDDIPKDTDVLVTHGPPKGVLDWAVRDGSHVGCENLLKITRALPLKLHVFGHLHESYGEVTQGGTTFVNCSVLDEHYQLRNEPVICEI
ncbi:MAG: metallophosphatase domain-containing protein [Nitrosomonadaceae bacterium]